MKITPTAAAAGQPGQSLTQNTTTASPDRREAAKQAFLGEAKLTPLLSDDPQVARAQANIRRKQMRTNVSPDRIEEPTVESAEELSVTPDATEASSAAEVTQPISPQMAALAKQRRALQVKESEILAREKALAEQPQTGIDLAKLKADPLSVLQEAGVTYDQLTEAILNSNSGLNPDLQAMQAKIDALEKGLDTKLSERDAQAEQQVLNEIKREAEALIAQGDEYENIREDKRQKDVVDLIHRTWKTSGEILDVAEAAKLVEDALRKDYLRYASRNSIKSQLTPAEAQAQVAQQSKPMRTLTNRDTASVQLSKRARAIAAMNGTLKK